MRLQAQPEATRDIQRYRHSSADTLVQFVVLDSLANVLCPACKLWNTGHGATMMREAVSLMGGYGITEDCPGFLGQKWMDAQLEATYEGPEAVQRRQLSVTMTNELFLAQFQRLDRRDARRSRPDRPGTGACTLATAMQLWLWTLNHLQKATDADGGKLYHSNRPGRDLPAGRRALLAAGRRYQILDVIELETKGPANPALAEGLPGVLGFLTDLCHVQARAPPAKWAASAPSWSTATIGIRPGTAAAAAADRMPAIRWRRIGVDATRRDDAGRPQGRTLRSVRRHGGVRPPAPQAGRLPDRGPPRQRPGRRGADQGHDPRGLGLPGMSETANTSPAGFSPSADRQTMEVDVVCVGFGPAMGGFLTTLSRGLMGADGAPALESRTTPGMPPQVICYERADDTAFGVSGVVTRARGIRQSFPDVDLSQIPLAFPVTHETVVYLLDPIGASRRSPLLRAADWCIRRLRGLVPYEHEALRLPYIPQFLRKDGGLLLSIGQFNQWVGAQVMGTGMVQIWPGMPVAQPLVEDGARGRRPAPGPGHRPRR